MTPGGRMGRALAALALLAAILAPFAALPPGPARAQDALSPAQKFDLLYSRDRKLGAEVGYGALAEENGVLTIRGLTYRLALPEQGAQGATAFMRMTVETMQVRRYDYGNPDMPRFSDLTMTGVRIGGSVFADDIFRRLAPLLGGKEAVFDVVQTYEADIAAGTITATNNTLTLRDVFRIALAGRFEGVDFARLSDTAMMEEMLRAGPNAGQPGVPDKVGAVFMAALGRARIQNLSLSFTDLGGVDRILALMAATHAQKNPATPKPTPGMLRRSLAGTLTGFGARRLSGSFGPAMWVKLSRAILEPGTLTVALRPERPQSFAGIIGFVAAFGAGVQQNREQKIDLDPLQKFLGLRVSFAPAAR